MFFILTKGPEDRDHFVYAPSQWEMMLQCNVILIGWAHTKNDPWGGIESTLHCGISPLVLPCNLFFICQSVDFAIGDYPVLTSLDNGRLSCCNLLSWKVLSKRFAYIKTVLTLNDRRIVRITCWYKSYIHVWNFLLHNVQSLWLFHFMPPCYVAPYYKKIQRYLQNLAKSIKEAPTIGRIPKIIKHSLFFSIEILNWPRLTLHLFSQPLFDFASIDNFFI